MQWQAYASYIRQRTKISDNLFMKNDKGTSSIFALMHLLADVHAAREAKEKSTVINCSIYNIIIYFFLFAVCSYNVMAGTALHGIITVRCC